MILKVTNFDILSVARITFILSFCVFLILSLLMFLFISPFLTSLGQELEDYGSGTIHFPDIPGLMLFFIFVFYAFIISVVHTFLITLIFWLYNMLSGYIGGIRITVKDEDTEQDAGDAGQIRSE